jgi:hypothetical protein
VYRHARTIGIVLAGIGVAILISFAAVALWSNVPDFRKALLLYERNSGNSMYQLQFFVATSELVFVIGGAIVGALVALNGVSWIALAAAVSALEQDRPGGMR